MPGVIADNRYLRRPRILRARAHFVADNFRRAAVNTQNRRRQTRPRFAAAVTQRCKSHLLANLVRVYCLRNRHRHRRRMHNVQNNHRRRRHRIVNLRDILRAHRRAQCQSQRRRRHRARQRKRAVCRVVVQPRRQVWNLQICQRCAFRPRARGNNRHQRAPCVVARCQCQNAARCRKHFRRLRRKQQCERRGVCVRIINFQCRRHRQ